MIFRNTLRALALVLCLWSAPAALAVPPADISPVIRMLKAKLLAVFSQPPDSAFISRTETAIQSYLASAFPQNADLSLNDAFIENLRSRIATLPQRDINVLRGLNQNDLNRRMEALLDSVAFYTLATDEILQRAPALQTAEWARLPDARPRRWSTDQHKSDSVTEWSQISQRYSAWKQQRLADQLIPYRSLVTDPAAPADVAAARAQQVTNAALPRAEWVRQFEAHLKEVYGQLGIQVAPGFFRDVAQLQYLLAGLTSEAGGVVPAAMAALRQIDAELAATGRSLPDMLLNWEQLRGFGGDPLIPVNILPPRDFIAMIEAGYIVLDVGTGPEHGAYAHSLQINILMRDFDMNPGAYVHTPVELITAIGAFDAQILDGPFFAMERPEPLWERVLDVAMPNAFLDVLARPESIGDVCRAQRATLPNLMRALERVYEERRNAGDQLFKKWQKAGTQQAALEKAFPKLDAAVIADILKAYTTLQNTAKISPEVAATIAPRIGEDLYQAMTYAEAQEAQYEPARIADAAGVQRDTDILVRGPDEVLRREPVAAEIEAEQAHRDELIRQRQPVPSAPDADDNDIVDAEPAAQREDDLAVAVNNDSAEDDNVSVAEAEAGDFEQSENYEGGLAALLDSSPMVDLPDYVFPASPDIDPKDEVAASSADAAREKDKKDGKDGQRAESSESKGKQAEMEPAQ